MILLLLLNLAGNPGELPVDFSVIEEGQHSPFTSLSAVVITNREVWEIGYSYLHATKIPSPKTPKIDFKDSVLILVTLGERRTAGFGIEVSSMFLKDDILSLLIREKCPKAGNGLLQVITQPYLILKIPRIKWKKIDVKLTDCQKKELSVPVKRGIIWLETIKK